MDLQSLGPLLGPDFTPVNALIGGLLIGLSAAIMLIANGRLAGISGLIEGAINPSEGGYNWRLIFLAGMPLGAFLVDRYFHEFFPQNIQIASDWLLIISAGFIVGFGTRLGTGCTSGHGVCGIPRFSLRSITATVIFFSVAAATVYVVRHTPVVAEYIRPVLHGV